MHKITPVIFALFIVCCKQPEKKDTRLSFKDSVVRRHFELIDSAEFYDTINYDFKVLKAYMQNDSAFFVKLKEKMDQTDRALIKSQRLDTCVHLQKLSDLGVDEAYRFSHWQSFCDYGQKITITRSGDKVQLHYIEFSNGAGVTNKFLTNNGDTITVYPYCTVAKEFKKWLSIKNWEELEHRLYNADYWGLKSYRYDLSFDGSSWQVEAYTKRPREPEGQQIHSVSRHCSCNDAFKALGTYFLKSSGETTMCGEFF